MSAVTADKSYTRFDELGSKAVILTMVSVLISMFMGALDQTIVATAMPSIVKSLRSFGGYSGVVSSYLTASTVALPIGGKLPDVYGRKRFLIGGMLWFTVASALCGIAQTMTQLILYRALKGIGTGVMQSAANTTIADLFPPIKRGKVIGIVSTLNVIANVIGPLLGGYLTDSVGWRYVFYINVPIGIIGALVAANFFPTVHRAVIKNFKVDYLGVITLVGGVVPLLLAFHNIGEKAPLASFAVAGLFVMGLLFSLIFRWVETKAEHPLVPLHVFKNPIISVSLFACGTSAGCMFGLTIFVRLFLQGVLHSTAKASGEVLIPLMATFAVVGTFTGFLVARINRYKILAIAGTLITAIGVFMLSQMGAETSYAELIRNTVIAGFGLAICMPLYNIAVQNAAKLEVLGVATSMVYFTRSMFASISVAIYGMILSAKTESSGLPAALKTVFAVNLGFVALTFLASLFLKEIPLRRSNTPVVEPAEGVGANVT